MFRVEEEKSELTQKITCKIFGKFVKVVDCEDPNNFCILPEKITGLLEKIKSMKVYEDDIWIVTNPKSGTTWTQEMVWLLANDLNYEKALEAEGIARVPFLELDGIMAGLSLVTECFEKAQIMERPRIMKTHLPAFLLPYEIWTVKPKIVYTIRNPKDAAVSWFHHHFNFHGWQDGNMETFIQAFVDDKMFYSPFNDHALKFWEIRDDLNILFLHFEDMKRDLKSVLQETSKFLGKSYSVHEIEKLCDYLSFDKMKNNKAANQAEIVGHIRDQQGLAKCEWTFLRKGKVGSHKEELTSELIQLLDDYVKQIDEKTGFNYKFE